MLIFQKKSLCYLRNCCNQDVVHPILPHLLLWYVLYVTLRMEYGFHAAIRLQIPFTIFRYFIAAGSQIYRFHKITSSELPYSPYFEIAFPGM